MHIEKPGCPGFRFPERFKPELSVDFIREFYGLEGTGLGFCWEICIVVNLLLVKIGAKLGILLYG